MTPIATARLSLAFVTLIMSIVNAAALTEVPTTGVTCLSSFGWMNNSLSQSPCLVAAYLEGACGTGYWNIPALPMGNTYNGPTASQVNLCQCSSVTYAATSACAACQAEPVLTWPAWKISCDRSLVSDASFNVTIPDRTAVPRWMFQDPQTQVGNTFNLTFAEAVAAQRLPDVTQKNQGPLTTPSTATSATASESATASAVAKVQHHSSNLGPIVGGTVGGLVVIALIMLLVWLICRSRIRRRGSQAPSQQYINKWSKNVPPGGASRWLGTPFSPSVTGDPIKERDTMMSSYPYSPEPRSTVNSPTYFDQARARGSASPTLHSEGHQSSSSKGRRGFHLHTPAASNVTPFVLPPLAAPTVVTGRAALSQDGGSLMSSNAAQQSHRATPSITSPALPSTIEYLGQRRPPGSSTAGMTNGNSRNNSRTSFGSVQPGYYDPDDPSTFPTVASAVASSDRYDQERPGYRRQYSGDAPPTSFNALSPISPGTGTSNYPDARQEKAALGRLYGQTPATRGHQTSSTSPPQLTVPTSLNTNMSMTGSIHTLPGLVTPNQMTPHEQPLPAITKSAPTESNTFLNSWRKKGNRRSVDLDADPVQTWAQQGSTDDFDPYRMN